MSWGFIRSRLIHSGGAPQLLTRPAAPLAPGAPPAPEGMRPEIHPDHDGDRGSIPWREWLQALPRREVKTLNHKP